MREDSKLAPSFQRRLSPLDHYQLLQLESEARTEMEAYLVIRAALVLGNNEAAQKLFESTSKSFESAPELRQFLSLQLLLYRKKEIEAVLDQLFQWNPPPLSDSWKSIFIKAEYQLILGFAFNLADQYRAATKHHKEAAALYCELKLFCHASVAWFNLCVAYNHLNERILFDLAYERLRGLVLNSPTPTTRLHYERMEIYRLVDREEDDRAVSLLEPLIHVADYLNRQRDKGGLVCLLGYLYLRNDNFESFWELENTWPVTGLASEHQIVFQELSDLSRTDLVSREEVRKRIQRWKLLQILSVHQLYLFDVILIRLFRAGDYEYLLKLAQQTEQLSVTRQQAMSLVDFRFHHIQGLIRTGQFEKARSLLASYHQDAVHDGAERRIQRTQALYHSLSEGVMGTRSDMPPAESSGNENDEIEADSLLRTLKYRKAHIDLSKRPLIWKFLQRLMRQTSPVSIQDLFAELYGTEFNPLTHERRFNSLIDRTRTLLGDTSAVVRREGHLSLRSTLTVRYRSTPAEESNVFYRRENILAAIAKSSRPLSIADLERKFSCSRRTLQFDLKYLIRSRAITHCGQARRRSYTVASS